jgi:hypothetical protein
MKQELEKYERLTKLKCKFCNGRLIYLSSWWIFGLFLLQRMLYCSECGLLDTKRIKSV